MKQFVAMTDDMLYRLDGPPGPIVPYQCGVFCWHRLRDEVADAAMPASRPAPPAQGEQAMALGA